MKPIRFQLVQYCHQVAERRYLQNEFPYELRYENLHVVVIFFAYAKTKAQISYAVIAQLISIFVFSIRIEKFIFYFYSNFKLLAPFYDCTVQFESKLVGTPLFLRPVHMINDDM